MFEKLPTEVRFFFEPGATIYMPGRVTPTVVRGHGYLTLMFEPTDRPELLSIRINDLHWRFRPFAIPVDVDRDGQLESIEITDVELNANHLDRQASRGTLNLQTGDMEIVFEYVIEPNQIPLLEKLGGKPIRFTVADRGKMDLRKGSFEIHSAVMGIEEWPLTGALIKGGGEGELGGPPPPPPSTVEMSVVIQTPGATGCGDIKNKEVLICPGDRVLLCWESSQDVASVELDPGSIPLPASGIFPVAPPGPPDIVYRVTTVGGNTVANDSVEVKFYQGQWLGPFMAEPDGFSWSIEFPSTSYSGRIEVHEVQLLKDGCLDWQRFLLEHAPRVGLVDWGRSIEAVDRDGDGFWDPINLRGPDPAHPLPVFRAAGWWYFSPQLDAPRVTPEARVKEAPPVCFRFRGRCVPV